MPKPKQAGGRPRDSRVDHAITAATRDVLTEHGYPGLTIDAVATRAGVGRAAIYRRYATKQEMIFSVVLHDVREEPPPDGGSLRADIAAVSATIATQLGGAPPGVLSGLLADVHADPALATRFAETFVGRERAILAEVLDRAVARGELVRAPDPATLQVLLLGPLLAWLLLAEKDDSLHDLARVVADVATTALLGGVVDRMP